MVRREGQAEFYSHHVQSLHMGPKDNAMTRYWQYQVGQTIQEHLYILKVGESTKIGPDSQILRLSWLMVRREGQAEFYSHHVQSLHMGPKDNAMTRYWQYQVGQTIQEHLYILEVGESTKIGPDSQILQDD